MRKDTYHTGLSAEALCRTALWLKFYRVLASRYRLHHGEISIVGARRKTLALIEMKARPSTCKTSEAITPHQRERLEHTASDFLVHHPRFNRHNVRFDVMLVALRRWPVHIKEAWKPKST